MKIYFLILFTLSLIPHSWARDYDVESWRCGAPLVKALRRSDPKNLLNDSAASLQLIESLKKISQSNMAYMKSQVGALSVKEQALFDLVTTKYQAPIVHRTSTFAAQIVLTTKDGLVSPVKRKAKANTPQVEQKLFAGHDCIFTSIGVPYGTERYGNTILRLKQGSRFGWATLRSGYHWIKTDLKKSTSAEPSSDMKREFAEQIITDESWNEAMAYQMIQNIRNGTSYRGQGKAYDKATITDDLLGRSSSNSFWGKVQKHRLAYMEGKHIENVVLDDMDWIQFRLLDQKTVAAWGLPSGYFGSLIEFYDREI
jgi:hypothetical protein